MPGYIDAISTDAVPEGGCAGVTVGGRDLAVVRLNGAFHAIDDACPHQGAPLSDGVVDGALLICPLHHWEFEVETGACLEDPGCPLTRHETRVEDGRVLIRLAETTG